MLQAHKAQSGYRRHPHHRPEYTGVASFEWAIRFHVVPDDPDFFLISAEIDIKGTHPYSIRSGEIRATYGDATLTFPPPMICNHEHESGDSGSADEDMFAGKRVLIEDKVSGTPNDINITLSQDGSKTVVRINSSTVGPEWIIGARHIVLMVNDKHDAHADAGDEPA